MFDFVHPWGWQAVLYHVRKPAITVINYLHHLQTLPKLSTQTNDQSTKMIHHGPEDHHAYLKFPRLIFFNLNGALSIAATALASQCKQSQNMFELPASSPKG